MTSYLKFLIIASATPIGGYVVVLAFATYTYFSIGHWPYYSHPDPKELNMPVYYGIASWATIMAFLSFLGFPLLFFASAAFSRNRNSEKKKKLLLRSAYIFLFGVVVWIVDGQFKSLASWIFD